jgi:hypothetical protein
MTRAATSASPFAAELLAGPRRTGSAIGRRYARFGDVVLAVTPPGALRMPNGLEAQLTLRPGERVSVGGGELQTPTAAIALGPLWDPRPRPDFALSMRPPPRWLRLEMLAGRGPGLTPLGDDVLVGYLAGAALAGVDPAITFALAERAARRTTALSATLLRLAARGQLPEAAHRFLEHGDLGPLLGFGTTSGTGIAVGLTLAVNVAGYVGCA